MKTHTHVWQPAGPSLWRRFRKSKAAAAASSYRAVIEALRQVHRCK